MKLASLLEEVEPLALSGEPEVEISAISCDSRSVGPGSVFVAVRGQKHDGHAHIEEAVAGGAVAVVGEKDLAPSGITYVRVANSRRALALLAAAFYGHPTRELFTVGVTGTKGKTTVAHLAQSVLGEAQTEIISTISNNLERGLANTTPDPLAIQRIARAAVLAGMRNLVLEVSAHGLSQERVLGVDFGAAVWTNLSHDHLDYYSTAEDYLRAKLRLFAMLQPSGTAVVNLDDPHGQDCIEATRAEVLTYGLSEGATIRARDLELGLASSRFLVRTPRGEMAIETALPGEFNVYNILAAIGVGLARGLPLSAIKQGVERVRRVEGRFERFPARGGFEIVIDFAHSPDALEKVLSALRPRYRRLITVFGCGGESDRLKRPVMGQISGRLSDYTIITSDNPKSEPPEGIIAEIEVGIRQTLASYEAIVDRREAIRRALALAEPGDVVLIAGKGHERTQIFADHEEEFNDRAFLEAEGVI
ncbi:MAG: UDP-N-acetylmuramoyl-L-alanyl-D-glutamate--2,6-diaminopimelate ligase [Candidatus Acetothermia bacterium]|nr:UDP-N-acetylmuramoyl-L-alanyl-D-glutamate--2,6-diaminopimelate ligase [Candidatus Acetothermia bacterium]MDH7505572.1 UDP-N-acetylmuramoyl-L-alanyl-D-glutamate--2,6-diaminopimelate ligase [Candidatus Acetothermia bacterium]